MKTAPGDEVKFTLLRDIGKLSHDGLLFYSLSEGKVTYANKNAFSFTGLKEGSTRKEVELALSNVIPEEKDFLKNQYSKVLNNSMTEVEFRLNSRDSESRVICVTAYRTEDVIIAFILDITEPKQHEDYLVEFGTRKNTLLENLTHHMSGALYLMQHLTGEAEKNMAIENRAELQNYLRLVSENSRSCIAMIDELLINEHEKSPKIFVKNARIDLVQKINFVHIELQQSYREREFLFQVSADTIFITTDEVKLLQVVVNLASNAIKFSDTTKPITFQIEDHETAVIISVKDQGIGIPDVLKPYMFSPQIGLGRVGLKGQKSRGMGLAICKSLVDLIQGRIWFETEEGKGTTFYISIPKLL